METQVNKDETAGKENWVIGLAKTASLKKTAQEELHDALTLVEESETALQALPTWSYLQNLFDAVIRDHLGEGSFEYGKIDKLMAKYKKQVAELTETIAELDDFGNKALIKIEDKVKEEEVPAPETAPAE